MNQSITEAGETGPRVASRDAGGRVIETVGFRLLPGVGEADFLAAVEASAALVAAQPGFLGRAVSRGEDGRWTDRVEWRDRMSAEAAAKAVMADPGFAPLMAAIDPGGVSIRHDHLVWPIGG